MSQWTPTAIANEPERERAHSSWSTIVVRRSAPPPPYFSSYSRPRNPSSPRRGQIDRRFPLLDVRHDLALDELPHRRAEHLVLLVEDLHKTTLSSAGFAGAILALG